MPYSTNGNHMHSRVSFGPHNRTVVDRLLLSSLKVRKLRQKLGYLFKIR